MFCGIHLRAVSQEVLVNLICDIDWMLDLVCGHQFWPWPRAWLWVFKVKYCICYITGKTVHLPRNKNKHISWTAGHKCCPQFWPWPQPWTLNFQGQIMDLLYIRKNDPTAMKWKMNIAVKCKDSNMVKNFGLNFLYAITNSYHDFICWRWLVYFWFIQGSSKFFSVKPCARFQNKAFNSRSWIQGT